MTGPALQLIGPGGGDPRRRTRWLGWLREHLDPAWRPEEWDGETWLFTGDLHSDRTAVWPCRTPDCPMPTRRHEGRCDVCRLARSRTALSWEDFDTQPPRQLLRVSRSLARCVVPGCEGSSHCHGMCCRHERLWRKQKTLTVEEFTADAQPFPRQPDCMVPGCCREGVTRRGLCRLHENRYLGTDPVIRAKAGLAGWAAAQPPLLNVHQFSLAGLPELVAVEVLYALQRRDRSAVPIDPTGVRILLTRVSDARSLRDADPQAACDRIGTKYNGSIKGLFRELRLHLDQAWARHAGIDPTAGDVWQVALLDLRAKASRPWKATQGTIDFRPVEVSWMREVVKDWARNTRPDLGSLRETILACRAASRVLTAAGRTDPTALGAGDFTRIADAVCGLRRDTGVLYSAAQRNRLLHVFVAVIEHGRVSGIMTMVPDSFRPVRRRRVRTEPNEDELGKALPDTVIRQLDARLDLLGPTGRAASIAVADNQRMHRTVYQILRDTGRRPNEVVSLRRDCIEIVDGQPNLIYDNHKSGRLRRRLPITNHTADTIMNWRAHRAELPLPPATDCWLFPTPLLRARQSQGHITSACIGRSFRAWVRRIGTIHGDLIGPDGRPAAFPPGSITPYALRHSYAQRHADAGVPVDVLRDLMDHVSVTTTMGYYRIALKRKQQAIRSVGSLAISAAGDLAPFTNPTAYQRSSVAVPFGNCTEPANVTAGGSACPIRFQCAGCGFYRPDPSYLPALEQHIADLRADRETALAFDTADYVQANLTNEIDAFSRIVEKMHRLLAELEPDERAEIERSSDLLRRARAGQRLPLTVQHTPTSEVG